MGSSMCRGVPSLPDAVIPFMLGGFQAALLLTLSRPLAWLGWLAAFYAVAIVAYHNMYSRSAEEERNAFVLARNRGFQRLNLVGCLLVSALLWTVFAYHSTRGSIPGWYSLLGVTLANVLFLLRGEANWRVIVAAARSVALARRGEGAATPFMRPATRREARDELPVWAAR
jgi:hypothetical protein